MQSKSDLLRNEATLEEDRVAWGRIRGPILGRAHCLPGKHAWVPETQQQRLRKCEARMRKGKTGAGEVAGNLSR